MWAPVSAGRENVNPPPIIIIRVLKKQLLLSFDQNRPTLIKVKLKMLKWVTQEVEGNMPTPVEPPPNFSHTGPLSRISTQHSRRKPLHHR